MKVIAYHNQLEQLRHFYFAALPRGNSSCRKQSTGIDAMFMKRLHVGVLPPGKHTGPDVVFHAQTQNFLMLISIKISRNSGFFFFRPMLINVQMQTSVGIVTFISWNKVYSKLAGKWMECLHIRPFFGPTAKSSIFS